MRNVQSNITCCYLRCCGLGVLGSSRCSCGSLDFVVDAVEDGRDVWSVVVKRGFGGYE